MVHVYIGQSHIFEVVFEFVPIESVVEIHDDKQRADCKYLRVVQMLEAGLYEKYGAERYGAKMDGLDSETGQIRLDRISDGEQNVALRFRIDSADLKAPSSQSRTQKPRLSCAGLRSQQT